MNPFWQINFYLFGNNYPAETVTFGYYNPYDKSKRAEAQTTWQDIDLNHSLVWENAPNLLQVPTFWSRQAYLDYCYDLLNGGYITFSGIPNDAIRSGTPHVALANYDRGGHPYNPNYWQDFGDAIYGDLVEQEYGKRIVDPSQIDNLLNYADYRDISIWLGNIEYNDQSIINPDDPDLLP